MQDLHSLHIRWRHIEEHDITWKNICKDKLGLHSAHLLINFDNPKPGLKPHKICLTSGTLACVMSLNGFLESWRNVFLSSRTQTHTALNFQRDLVIALCVVYNFLRSNRGLQVRIEKEAEEEFEMRIRQENFEEFDRPELPASLDAKLMRDSISQTMWDEYVRVLKSRRHPRRNN